MEWHIIEILVFFYLPSNHIIMRGAEAVTLCAPSSVGGRYKIELFPFFFYFFLFIFFYCHHHCTSLFIASVSLSDDMGYLGWECFII